jgi:uroporphyrinogen-III synthase
MSNNTVEQIDLVARRTKVNSILITQPKPQDDNSPYHALAKKYKLKIEFRPFIEIEGESVREFRRQKVNILDHTAVIFTSKNAVDNFFRICAELKIEVPADMKYFCVTEQTANYLQKYIVIRKRKIFAGNKTASDLFDYFKKHKTEKYLYPCSDIRLNDIPDYMKANNIFLTEAVFYRTVPCNLSDINISEYDIIAFFSSSGVEALLSNFPDYKQNSTRIAAFGPSTAKAVIDNNLILDIQAPLPNAPSMSGALEEYIKLCQK